MRATQPRYHTTEDGRWDYRITIVFKNAAIANDNFDASAIIKEPHPDQDTHKKEEQRHFEILDGHWDLPIKDVDLTAKLRRVRNGNRLRLVATFKKANTESTI